MRSCFTHLVRDLNRFSLKYVQVSSSLNILFGWYRTFSQHPTGFYNLTVFRNDDLPLPLRPSEVRVHSGVPSSPLTPTSLLAQGQRLLHIQMKIFMAEKETFSVRWDTVVASALG